MSPKKSVRQCVVYARISVSDPKSVAIAHQLESCTKYAESRGWSIAGTFVDDGVSASKTRPEDRPGWRAMLDSPGPYQAVVALKLDRVARRAIDFLRSHEALEARGAAVVLVDDSIDMGSGSGKAYATILAALAEAEAAAISDRSVENPRGAGKIIEQDPTTIEVLRDMVERALGGQTVHGISKELGRAYRGVEHALRHPILAGYILHNPGQVGHDRGTEVIRGVDGMPLVRPELAVITPAERRRLLDILDVKNKPQRMPRADRRVTSPFLSRIIVCDVCGKVMLRGTRADKKAALYCRNRCQSIDATRAADVIVERLLGERGDFPVSELLPDDDDDPQSLAEIDLALRDLGAKFAMTDPGDERDELLSTIDGLRELRARAAIEKPGKPINERIIWGSVREALAEAGDDDLARRAVLASQLGEIRLMKGIKGGRLPDGSYFDPSRIVIEWRPGAEPSEPTWRPGDDFEAVAS
jgi:DNA invertase Pin-like site-specific DNA recombinase